ncbi:DUF6518 family protein [Sphaerisporangium sp. NPDC005289]|uniref:DUF6518 family protein n=1 Tax=Sphaerisporangium sp. NPDC005289 TaxID=3155247 RepID=UPI0033B8C0B4
MTSEPDAPAGRRGTPAAPRATVDPAENTPPRTWVVAVVAVAAGVLLGLLDLLAQVTLPYPWADLANSPAVWAAAAFAVGAWARRGLVGVCVAAVVLLVLAVETYYAAAVVFRHDDAASLYNQVAWMWIGFGVVAGVVFGVAGVWYRGPDRWRADIGLAALGGVFVAEAAKDARAGTFGLPTVLILTVIALLVPIALGRSARHRLESLALVVPLALLGAVAYIVVM